MSLVKWNPMREMMNFQDRFFNSFPEGFFGRFNRLLENSAPASHWHPVVDIYETDSAVVLRAELPGISKKDVHLEVRDHTLVLTGERQQEEEVKGEHYYRVERSYGSFCRAFGLPSAVEADKVKASMKDGVLEITLPKAEEAKSRMISIENN